MSPETQARAAKARSETYRLRAEAIAVMKMNGWSVLDIARMLRLRPSTVRSALRRGR